MIRLNKLANNIKRFFLNIFYSIPFGMKGAEDEIMKQKSSSVGNDTVIGTNVSTENIYADLLQENETQEVKELRYNTYYTCEEARKYKYFGGERAMKIPHIKPIRKDVIKFTQMNKMICDSVIDELERIDTFSSDKFTLDIVYNEIPKFKLERYAEKFSVYLDEKEKRFEINIFFPLNVNEDNIRYRIFLAFLTKLDKNNVISDFNHFLHLIKAISFITEHVQNAEDYSKFILRDVKFNDCKISEKNHQYFVLTFLADYYYRESLLEKYYNKEADQKYKEKAPKSNTYQAFNEQVPLHKCSICNKPISSFDANLSKMSVGMELCLEHFQEKLKENVQ